MGKKKINIIAALCITAVIGSSCSVNADGNDENAEVNTEETNITKLQQTNEDKGFGCIISENGDVYWKTGTDSCDDLKEIYELDNSKNYLSIHIVPDNDEKYPYLYPDEPWIMMTYNMETPEWFTDEMSDTVWDAFGEWKNSVYNVLDYKGLLSLSAQDTIDIAPDDNYQISSEDIDQFISFTQDVDSCVTYIRVSVYNTLYASIGTSVGSDAVNYMNNEIRKPAVEAGKVEDRIVPLGVSNVGVIQSNFYAAILGGYLKEDNWIYYTGNAGGYPYEAAVYLWKNGLYPSQDSNLMWRLHSANGGEILYEISNDKITAKKAFAVVLKEDGTTYWKIGLDDTSSIKEEFDLKDGDYVEVQVFPGLDESIADIVLPDGNNPEATRVFPYLDKNTIWTVNVLNEEIPEWYNDSYEEALLNACTEWKSSIFSNLDFEAAKEVFTEKTKEKAEYTADDIKLLAEWATVWHDIYDKGIEPTVAIKLTGYEYVGRSVWDDFDAYLLSAWRAQHTQCPGKVALAGYCTFMGVDENGFDKTISDVVGNSVSDVMEALAAYYFDGIDGWKYYDGDQSVFPFKSGVELVIKNLVPYTDGEYWYLCTGENAEVVYQISETELLS